MEAAAVTPDELLDALGAMFPDFSAEWEQDERPTSFHGVLIRFTPFFGSVARTSPPHALRRLGNLINAAVAAGGPLENAMSTCLLEHLHQVGAWKMLQPYLSDPTKRRTRARARAALQRS
jgi:hypothetical protein